MNTVCTIAATALLAASLLMPAHAIAQEEEKSADLESYSVGDRRPVIDTKIEIERPKIETDFKLEPPKPAMSGIQMARPTFQVLEEPAQSAARPESEPVRTADSGGAPPAVTPPAAGGVTTPIRPLRMNPPDYPREAVRRRQEGYVVVEFTINTNGETEDIAIIEAQPRGAFDSEARRAVARWTFTPAMRDGRPVPQRIRHTLEFTLNGK